jgi:DNA polymerase-1
MTEGAQMSLGSDLWPAFGAPVTVADLYERCRNAPTVAFDTETSGPIHGDPTFVRDNITVVSFAWGPGEDECTAMPAGIGCGNGSDRPVEHIDEFTRWLLTEYQGRVVAHNKKFDLHMTRKEWDITARMLVDDSMVQCHLLDENRPKALKKQGDILNMEADRFLTSVKRYVANNRLSTWYQIPFHVFGPYSAYDTHLTWRLDARNTAHPQWGEFTELYDTEMKLTQLVLLKMEEQGVLVDRDFLQGQIKPTQARMDKAQRRLDDLVGHPLEVGSDAKLSAFLYEELRLPILGRTKQGAPSTDINTLRALRATLPRNHKYYPLLGLIEEWRDAEKDLTTYIKPTLDASQYDGRAHPDFNTTAARTGRFGCSGPNVQQVKKKGEEGNLKMRKAYLMDPGVPAWFLDYSQIEMRGFAHYTNEPRLIDAFVQGEDVYSEMAAWIYGGDRSQYPKGTPERDVGKTVALAVIYGAGPGKIGEQTGTDKAGGERIIRLFREGSPKSAKLLDGVRDKMRSTEHIKNGFGRWRRDCHPHCEAGHHKCAAIHKSCPFTPDYVAVNSLIQGWAADLIKKAMVRIETEVGIPTNAGQGWRKQVHDEIRLDGLEPAMIRDVRDAMCDFPDVRVPITVDVNRSETTWYDADTYKLAA